MNGDILKKFELKSKTAVVTGATGFLGKHFCRGLAESGANVIALDLKEKDTAAFAEGLAREYGVRACGFQCDVSSPASAQSVIDRVAKDFGTIEILVNNAATKTEQPKKFFEPDLSYGAETWREVMAVNADGAFFMSQAVAQTMVRTKSGGSIIQVGSIYGMMAPDQRIYEGSEFMGLRISSPAVYSASKAAVHGLTRHLATLLADQGIRVNTLVPGGIQSGQNQTFVENYSKRIPMARMAKPEEMVAAMIFLASEASSYITGQALMVDGGLSAW